MGVKHLIVMETMVTKMLMMIVTQIDGDDGDADDDDATKKC